MEQSIFFIFNTLLLQARQLLDDFYGYGRFETKITHKRRIKTMLKYFIKTFHIKNLADITLSMRMQHVHMMLAGIENGTLKVTTAHNYTTTLNTLCLIVFGNNSLWISAKEHFGPRQHIRTEIPKGMDVTNVDTAGKHMSDNGYPIFHMFLLVIRGLGLRIREAVTQDYVRLYTTMSKDNRVRIIEGTKGGCLV